MEEASRARLRQLAEQFIPNPAASELAIEAPGEGFGFWNGSSSAVEVDGVVYLAYRHRQPVELGRGQGVVLAKSTDGVHFETITMVKKEYMDAESLERPTLIYTPEGKWRLYLSCATTGTKHWRVELLEANEISELPNAERRMVLPGDELWGVKDTVIQLHDGLWHLWATMHPLDIVDAEDRMVTDYFTSADGLAWQRQSTALAPTAESTWDSRGTRLVAAHFAPEGVVAFYDGRASASENFDERTGIAVGETPDALVSVTPDGPVAEAPDHKALRYLDIVPLANGGYRLYYEFAKPDGSHELRTELR